MTKRIISGVVAVTLLASLGLAGACTEAVQAKTGTIEVRVTDAPPEYDIETIDVTFSTVEVHKAGTDEEDGVWITIGITNGEIELLELEAADLEALLATGDGVPAGKYTQLRVIIDAVVVTLVEGEPPEVILPSGELKFVRPFEVFDGETTILLLDFDADKSLTVTGNGTIIVKPVVTLAIQEVEPE